MRVDPELLFLQGPMKSYILPEAVQAIKNKSENDTYSSKADRSVFRPISDAVSSVNQLALLLRLPTAKLDETPHRESEEDRESMPLSK